MISLVLLAITQALLACEDNKVLTPVLQQPKELPTPLVIGNKAISQRRLLKLSDDQQEELHRISHPGTIARCFGYNSQVISPQDVKTINTMPDWIRKDMKVKVLTVNHSCCVSGPVDRHDNYTGKAAALTGIASGLAGCVFYTVMFFGPNCPWSFCAIPIAGVPPMCAAGCAECSSCIYHRYYAERQEYAYADHNEISSE